MLEFLHTVYTLPNFSSVCRGFNLGRVEKTQDNFLVALYHINNYFENRNRDVPDWKIRYILAEFISDIKINNITVLSQDIVIDEAQNWLSPFSDFAEFINTYDYQDFLEDPTDSYSKPKELWDGMFEGTLMPSKEEFIPSIEFLTNSIKSRGNRMSKAWVEVQR